MKWRELDGESVRKVMSHGRVASSSQAFKPEGGRRRKQVEVVRGKEIAVPTRLKPLERAILETANSRKREGQNEFYGYELAQALQGSLTERGHLTKGGAIYKALKRLDKWGFLESRIEDLNARVEHYGSARILYSLTPAGISRLDPNL